MTITINIPDESTAMVFVLNIRTALGIRTVHHLIEPRKHKTVTVSDNGDMQAE